ncbi:cadmium resistance transporter [Synechocystis sp. LKSZ1]|uniref:cadmium resistance transporter n=1 Tax=Synechocystis sp. LKSZ1 TaxID=3144951 RepID=UPI00336C2FA6
MDWLLQITLTAISSFAATNIDDILILMFLFSQVKANPKLHIHQLIIGQYLGFSLIILLSLPGFIGGLVIPKAWIGLLGFLPIAIGAKQLWQGLEVETVSELHTVTPNSSTGFLKHKLTPFTYSVATITFANGGDNIGIYVPFFASLNGPGLLIVLSLFFSLVGLWCAVAYWLTRHTLIAKILTHRGKRIVPFVLIALGCFIVWENRSYALLIPR